MERPGIQVPRKRNGYLSGRYRRRGDFGRFQNRAGQKADKFVEVWTDYTNVAETIERDHIHKIVNAYVITDDALGGTDEEVERGLRDAYEI